MDDSVEVRNPKALGKKLPAQRIPIGGFYKPCNARLPGDELRLIAESVR